MAWVSWPKVAGDWIAQAAFNEIYDALEDRFAAFGTTPPSRLSFAAYKHRPRAVLLEWRDWIETMVTAPEASLDLCWSDSAFAKKYTSVSLFLTDAIGSASWVTASVGGSNFVQAFDEIYDAINYMKYIRIAFGGRDATDSPAFSDNAVWATARSGQMTGFDWSGLFLGWSTNENTIGRYAEGYWKTPENVYRCSIGSTKNGNYWRCNLRRIQAPRGGLDDTYMTAGNLFQKGKFDGDGADFDDDISIYVFKDNGSATAPTGAAVGGPMTWQTTDTSDVLKSCSLTENFLTNYEYGWMAMNLADWATDPTGWAAPPGDGTSEYYTQLLKITDRAYQELTFVFPEAV